MGPPWGDMGARVLGWYWVGSPLFTNELHMKDVGLSRMSLGVEFGADRIRLVSTQCVNVSLSVSLTLPLSLSVYIYIYIYIYIY